MDPLSDVLSLLRPSSTMCGGLDLGAPWSIGFPAYPGIKCYSIVRGACWLVMDGIDEAVRLEAGDCFVLPLGRAFRLASDVDVEPVDVKSFLPMPLEGDVFTYRGGGDCFGVGGQFTLAGAHAEMLLNLLPPIVHIRRDGDRAALRWTLERMMDELRERLPGSSLVVEQLAYAMLVQALRLHLVDASGARVGWLFALADRAIGAAIAAMHERPAHRWTLAELAKQAGMSRSIFAVRFKATVGTSPMDYLTRWRMLLAADRLTRSDASIAEIAYDLGYDSESAFGKTFKKLMHASPRRYGRRSETSAA